MIVCNRCPKTFAGSTMLSDAITHYRAHQDIINRSAKAAKYQIWLMDKEKLPAPEAFREAREKEGMP